MSSRRLEISTLDKLVVSSIVVRAVFRFLYGLVRAWYWNRLVLRSAATLFVKTLFDNASGNQIQWLLPSTDWTYTFLARRLKSGPQSVTFADGSKGHWIGRKDAPQVLLYYHGGGYVCPATIAHVEWLWALKRQLEKNGKDISVLLLSYQLADSGVYPKQLRQGVHVLRYLLDVERLQPSQILLGGDSAGGNLAMGVLSHLIHPHPAIPELRLEEPLSGVLLLSPWISFDYSPPGFQESEWDMLSKQALSEAERLFLGTQPKDNYNEPIRAPTSWWAPVAKATSSIFIWYGGDEVLRHSIKQIASTLATFVDCTTVTTPQGTHVCMFTDTAMRTGPTEIDEEIISWLSSRCSSKPAPRLRSAL